MSSADVFDPTPCTLGEGPLWHPEREMLYWFDILNKKLLWRNANSTGHTTFDEHVSAAGWVDMDTVLLASASGLWRYDLDNGEQTLLAPLEADSHETRSNDGRADPYGGFWIGTMGLGAEKGAGAIYRYYQGEVRKLYGNMTITNSICFAPDGSTAYFCDTIDGRIMKQRLSDKDGWPVGDPEVFLDVRGESFGADGSVVDAAGNVWNAQWGASRVACYAPDGTLKDTVTFLASQISCPAFGGTNFDILFATSAQESMSASALAAEPLAGQTFAVPVGVKGQKEHQVIL